MPKNPEHVRQLIQTGRELASAHQFGLVMGLVLIPTNNLRSGWNEEVDRVYFFPETEEEREYSQSLSELILLTVAALLETSAATEDVWGYMMLEYIATFLSRLGAAAPTEYVQKTKELILESQRLGAREAAFISPPALVLLEKLERQ